jgi:hypothetical protein
MIEVANVSVAWTITGESEFGSMCRNTIVFSLTPSARAANTWSVLRWASIEPRSSRAKIGTLTMATAVITVHWLGLAASAAMEIASSSDGTDSRMSVKRIRMLSAQPPRAPAAPPMIIPATRPIRVAITPTISDCREPTMSRLSRSRPFSSVPSGKPSRGGSGVFCRISSIRYRTVGSFGASNGAKIASRMKISTITAPTIATGLRANRRNASTIRLTPPSSVAAVAASASILSRFWVAIPLMRAPRCARRHIRGHCCASSFPRYARSPDTHPGVDDRVGDVHQQVDYHVYQRDHQDQRLQPRIVTPFDALR